MNIMDFSNIYPAYKRFLIFAPHQDDEVFGCGGLLYKINSMHDTVVKIVYVTDGSRGGNEDNLSEIRYNEARALLSYIKVSDYSFLNLPDSNVQNYKDLLLDLMMDQINSFMPDVVLAPHLGEEHPDHLAVAEAASNIRSIMTNIKYVSYEVWQKIAAPNYYYILSVKEFYKKCKMLNYYRSQKQVFGLMLNARVRGKEINSKYAEAYIINGGNK